MPYKSVAKKSIPQECPTRVSHKSVLQDPMMLYEMPISILYEVPFGYPCALDVVEDVPRAFYKDLWCHILVPAALRTRSMSA